VSSVNAIDLRAWIERHREELRPPVGNARVFDDGDFIVMVVGGPNARKDFHVDPGDELFFQIEGGIVLEVIEDGRRRAIEIAEGGMLLLPGGVPHSPQRPAGTVGLVVERRRRAGERDVFRWYCEHCDALVHEVGFELHDIATQIRDAIESLRARREDRTCRSCGRVIEI
jgi:3-hydroxyanthranilate 3,4-dioxygenase